MSQATDRPTFTGLIAYRDRAFNYSFFVPDGWYRREVTGAGDNGVFYAPSLDDPLTGFSAEARDLGVTVTAEDLPSLRAGFLAGIRKMSGSRIESQEAESIGSLITMEARHTYRDQGATRKRWVRLLYQGSTQVRLVAQGETVDAFQYWLPMFFESMRTFRFGDWAADVGMANSD